MKKVKELLQSDDVRSITLNIGEEEISGLLSEYRVDHKEDLEGKFLYDIRHADNDWCEPATLEKRVMVNWFGTLIMDNPIECLESGNKEYLEITDYDIDY